VISVGNLTPQARISRLRFGNVVPSSESIRANDLYRLARKPLGVGTYAQVLRAEHRETDEVVALKRVKSRVSQAEARIKREIEAQRMLAPHPNIMPIFDHDPGYKWYTMPIARGTLDDLKAELDDDSLAGILHDLANALDVAHQQGIIHRDISPRNILALAGQGTSGGDRWVVADWGMVSRLPGGTSIPLTRTGMAIGTPGYDAPELDDDPRTATPATDVYSLGRVAAWFLTGQRPKPGQPLLPDGDSLRWRPFVKGCTEHNSSDRIQNMADLDSALNNVFTIYDGPPAQRTKLLLHHVLTGDTPGIDELIALGLAHPDDPVIHIDHIAQIPTVRINVWAAEEPDSASIIACQIAQHLVSSPWEDRDRAYVGIPLGFIFAVLRALTEAGYLAQAQDVAGKFFRADIYWRYEPQRQRSVHWLHALTAPNDRHMAQLLTQNPDLIKYYGPLRSPRSSLLETLFRASA
jgi:eukaryotic-like serine/threonine-protein kinase